MTFTIYKKMEITRHICSVIAKKLNASPGSSLYASVLLVEQLAKRGIDARIISGFQVEMHKYRKYFWVELNDGGAKFDPVSKGQNINILTTREPAGLIEDGCELSNALESAYMQYKIGGADFYFAETGLARLVLFDV